MYLFSLADAFRWRRKSFLQEQDELHAAGADNGEIGNGEIESDMEYLKLPTSR